jgi:hypothetical protein
VKHVAQELDAGASALQHRFANGTGQQLERQYERDRHRRTATDKTDLGGHRVMLGECLQHEGVAEDGEHCDDTLDEVGDEHRTLGVNRSIGRRFEDAIEKIGHFVVLVG